MKLRTAQTGNPPEAGKPQKSRISNRRISKEYFLQTSTFIIGYSIFFFEFFLTVNLTKGL